MGLIERSDKIDYWGISQGALRKKADEDDPKAIKREYTTKKGEKKVIWEIVCDGISGYIRDVELRDGDFGEQLMVYIDDVDNFALQMSWDSSEAMSFAEKLKGIDISKEVEIKPYYFTPKGRTKAIRGVSVYQDGNKLDNYFVKRDADGRVVGHIEDFPTPDGDTDEYDTEDWKMYFMQQKKFLRKHVIEKFPFIDVDEKPKVEKPKKDAPSDEKDDLPF